MNFDWLLSIRDGVWLYLAAPLLLLTGLWLTLRFRLPQLTRVGEAIRAVRKSGDADGEMAAWGATMWNTAGMLGAAGAVGAATSVALGGAGALVWIWVWTFLLAPLRLGEAILARTSVAGSKGDAPTSLVARLRSEKNGTAVAAVLAVCLCIAAFGFGGAAQGEALRTLTNVVVPGATIPIGVAVMVGAAALVLLGAKRTGSFGGFLALFCVASIFGVALLSALADPGRALGALGRTFSDALEGAPTVSAFAGALAGEVARAALVHSLIPTASTTGFAGSVDAMSRGGTRAQAHAAMIPPFVFALVTTTLGIAFVATGTYSHTGEDVRPFSDVSVYEVAFESPSQRLEGDGLRSGPMRIRGGQLRDSSLVLATERGIITNPTFTYYGSPADLAIDLSEGRAEHLARYQGLALGEIPLAQTAAIMVHGEMLPSGPTLLTRAMARGALRKAGSQLVFAALVMLSILGSAIFGLALMRAAQPFTTRPWLPKLLGVLPALGFGIATLMHAPALSWLGEIGCALASIVVAIVVTMRSDEIWKRIH
ncbi:MAG: sodium:alanine symporter family protein [Sandaracinaceae bacterium]|jgi:Na+/alanine symporter|nr:sodium:alanine symporter family protein [Sandaracinaceae bacterium]